MRVAAVVLATGGFQRNLDKSREHWPKDVPVPPKLLSGSGKFSLGIGLDMAQEAGADVYRIDRQYNSYAAIPDPREPSGTLGLGGGNALSIWVNTAGKRFVDPRGFDRDVYRKVLAQPGSTYWAIFDSQTKGSFRVGAADWGDRPALAAQVLADPNLTKTADTLVQLAALTQLPAAALEETVRRYNDSVASGKDAELESFDRERAEILRQTRIRASRSRRRRSTPCSSSRWRTRTWAASRSTCARAFSTRSTGRFPACTRAARSQAPPASTAAPASMARSRVHRS